MGRPLRDQVPGRIYHVNAHGVDDRPIFRDDVDRQTFVLRLLRIALREHWQLHAVCLLDTHYHAVIQPRLRSLGNALRVVHGAHSRAFNRRHGRRGPPFEPHYFDRHILTEEHLARAVEYVEQNAVEAGIVRNARDWPWSTHDECALRTALARCLAR